MTPTHFEQLRKAIIEAVPEIMALPEYPYNPEAAKAIVVLEKIAGKTLWNETLEQTATLMIDNYRKQQQADYRAMLEQQYPGREIQLHDVLRAIGKSGHELGITQDGLLMWNDGKDLERPILWNLSLPLSGQSPELKEFLYKLIVKE